VLVRDGDRAVAEVVTDAVVAIGAVRIERDVRNHDEAGHVFLERGHGALEEPARIGALHSPRILLCVTQSGKESDGRDAQIPRGARSLDQEIDTEP